jgi:beta-N-acetylhexosaminidase
MRYRPLPVLLLLPLLVVLPAAGVEPTSPAPSAQPGLRAVSPERVEAALQAMSLEEKVGQLLMSYPPLDKTGPVRVGGVVLVGNLLKDAEKVKARVADLQARSTVPLLIAADVEGGELNKLGFMPGLEELPAARELGLGSHAEAQSWAVAVGEGMKELGINTALAPVLDVAGSGLMYESGRSFGADPGLVASMGSAYVQGLAQAGVLAIGKHYPGYGDLAQNTDFHLLVREVDAEQLERESAVFRQVGSSLAGVMIGNVGYPMHGSKPAIICPEIVRQAHQQGWPTVTDDLAIGTLAQATGDDPAELFLEAFRAGNDILLTTAPPDWDKGIDYLGLLEAEVRADPSLLPEVDERVRRVLTMKDRLGLLE